MDQSGDREREERTPPPTLDNDDCEFCLSFLSRTFSELLALVARVAPRSDHRVKSKRAILSPFIIEDRKYLADLLQRNDA